MTLYELKVYDANDNLQDYLYYDTKQKAESEAKSQSARTGCKRALVVYRCTRKEWEENGEQFNAENIVNEYEYRNGERVKLYGQFKDGKEFNNFVNESI